jgi:hypothetical protein
MRLFTFFICILVSCLWVQVGNADIYVWVDENGVKHFSNGNPPAHAKVLMRTKEIPYDESADHARQETERQQELLQAQTEILEIEAQLAEQQVELQRRIAEADRKAEEALQHTEDLLDYANDRYDSDHKYYSDYAYYPKNFKPRHYRSSKYHYPAYGGIYYHKPHKFRKGLHRFKQHRFSKSHYFRKHFESNRPRHGKDRKKFNTGRHHFRKYRFKDSRFSQLRQHTVGRVRF